MKKPLLLLVPGSLVLASVVACDIEIITGGLTAGDDAGTTDGGKPSAPPDAGATDASSSDASPTTEKVTVRVRSAFGPEAGVRVVFHDATGAVLETGVTDGEGKAFSTTTQPAMASALVDSGARRDIVTWTGLEPGDVLELLSNRSDAFVGSYDVTLPGPFGDGGSTDYTVSSGNCFGELAGLSATIRMERRCVHGSQGAVLATARDRSTNAVAYSFAKGNPVPSNGGSVAVATNAWREASTLGVTVTNVPGDASIYTTLLEIADGYGFFNDAPDDRQSSTPTFKTAAGFADAYQATVSVQRPDGSLRGLVSRFAPAPSVAFDASQMLPAITSTTTDTTSFRRPVVHWTASSTAETDGGLVHLAFAGPGYAHHHWTLVVAPGSTSVTAPAMPAEAEGFLPEPDAGSGAYFGNAEVLFMDAPSPFEGYTAFRRKQGAMLGLVSGFGGSMLPALPVEGTYRTTTFVELPY